MLESVAVILGIVVEVVRVTEKVFARTEHITAADIRTRQANLLRMRDFEGILALEIKRFADLVTQVGVRVFVSDNLHRILHANCSVVGCQDNFVTQLGYPAEEFIGR